VKVTLGHHTFWGGNHALAFDDAFGFSYATLVVIMEVKDGAYEPLQDVDILTI